jgi:hypothetical protein
MKICMNYLTQARKHAPHKKDLIPWNEIFLEALIVSSSAGKNFSALEHD